MCSASEIGDSAGDLSQLERDIYEDADEIGYTRVWEYHWDVSLFGLRFFLCVFCPTFFALYCLEEQTQVLLGTVLV
jgi:hypothetical protein